VHYFASEKSCEFATASSRWTVPNGDTDAIATIIDKSAKMYFGREK
jgi:hypothetical protein